MLEIKKILFPVDFTESSRKVLPHVKYIAEKFGARIHLIHVVRGPEEFTGFEMGTAWFSTYETELVDGAEKAMERLIEEEMTDVKDVERFVAVGEVAEEIIGYADKIGADIIIMGTHGRKGLEKILFGSVARGVVEGANCPVLTVNPHRVGV